MEERDTEVFVRYWAGSKDTIGTAESSRHFTKTTGHIAIEFGDHYVSLWPAKEFHLYDIFKGGVKPVFATRLDGFNTQKMEEYWSYIESGISGWNLFTHGSQFNCCLIAVKLLLAGASRNPELSWFHDSFNFRLVGHGEGLRYTRHID